jgi:hypothetical protein
MAAIEQLQQAERRMLELLEAAGLPEPDDVEYGNECIRLFWQKSKVVIVVDVD